MSRRRSLFASMLLSAAAPAFGGGGVTAQEASDWAEGYFQLYVEQIPRRPTIVALVEQDRVLVPLSPILLLTEVPMHFDGDRRVLEWPPDVWRTTLDPAERTIEIAQDVIRVPEAAWVEQDGEIFLGTEHLARLLASDVRVDMANLVISITDGPEFPAVLRSRQALRRTAEAARAQVFDPRQYEGVPYPARTGGFAAGWSVSMTQSSGGTSGLARPTVGAGLLGGAAEVGFTSSFYEGRSPTIRDVTASYQRVFPENDRVRQINIGTFRSNGVVARPIVGASISNEPWITPRYFDQTVLTPPVPAGWEYEIYQGSRLVGVSSADAPREVEAPLSYGSTPMRIRMIGPAGQEQIQDLVYFVPSTQIPAGRTRYSAGGGACNGLGCDAYAFAEIGHGLSRRWTAYGGADYLATPGESQIQPYARVGFAATGALNLGLQARGDSFLRGDVRGFWGRGGQLGASYSWTRPDGGVLGPAGWVGQLTGSAPIAAIGGPWLHGRLFLRGLESDRVDAWQAGLSTSFGLTNVSLDVESGLQASTMTTGRVQQTLVGGLPWSIDNIAVGGGLGTTTDGIELLEAGAQVRTRGGAVVDARFRARRGFQPSLALGVTLQSPLGFLRGRSTSGGSSSYFLGADGGVVYDRDVGVMPLTFQTGVGRGGVTGEVFYDLDGDGVRSDDEPPVEGAGVIIEGWRSKTDEEGRFTLWELTPYEGASVVLDSLSVDPEWAPVDADLRLRPSPNLFTRVSIPLRRTRELMGSVLASPPGGAEPGASGTPLAGAGVEVVNLLTGEVVLTERTFSDGVFYATRLRPGLYRLRLSAPTAAALGLTDPPEIAFEIPQESGPPVEVGPLILPRANGR
jgi:hypothetical protein